MKSRTTSLLPPNRYYTRLRERGAKIHFSLREGGKSATPIGFRSSLLENEVLPLRPVFKARSNEFSLCLRPSANVLCTDPAPGKRSWKMAPSSVRVRPICMWGNGESGRDSDSFDSPGTTFITDGGKNQWQISAVFYYTVTIMESFRTLARNGDFRTGDFLPVPSVRHSSPRV